MPDQLSGSGVLGRAVLTPKPSCLTSTAWSPMTSAMCCASKNGVASSYCPTDQRFLQDAMDCMALTELPIMRTLFAYVPLNGP